MKVPPNELLDSDGDESAWDKEDYPHFFIFCQLQLGRSMSSADQHWLNAKVIAGLDENKIKTMTFNDFVKAGVDMS